MPTELEKGEVIDGRYVIEARLGRGGMGEVVQAFDRVAERRIALKRLDPGLCSSRKALLRFQREYHTLVSLSHPRIVEVFAYGVDATGPYYTMELLDGVDLKEVGALEPRDAARLMRDVAAALALLHARGLVHRDLAPRNVRQTADGRAKLLDFGILCSVGATGEWVGTPAYTAPESVRRMSIDGRTDLFSLGLLGYWLLTGRVAYRCRAFAELEEAWKAPPPPPSSIASGIPPALEELVLSMMSLDPLARPVSAAEAIDRLTAAARLDPAPDLATGRGYLASAAMVGRRAELASLRHALEEASAGQGRAALIEAESGAGKSRLLRELAIEAEWSGALVASVSCETAPEGPYGLVERILEALSDRAPREVGVVLASRAPDLSRALPGLAPRLGSIPPVPRARDAGEERMRVQRAIQELILELCRWRTVVLVVDDVQRCDDASAAVLAALLHELPGHALLVVGALRTGEPIRAPGPLRALRRAPLRLSLGGLGQDEVGELVRSLFGGALHGERLAQYLHRVTGGSPLWCLETARHLVDVDAIRFLEGEWILPEELPAELPGLAAAMDARVARLSGEARALGEVLAVHGGELAIELVADLAGDPGGALLFACLDELVGQGVLVGDTSTLRFRHDGLREALVRGLPADRKATIHRRVGETLLATGSIPASREAEIGWHLLHGGVEAAGARLLLSAGRRLFEAQALHDCIAPLEASFAVLERRGAPESVLMELSYMLLAAGWTSDREVGSRHAPRAVESFRRQSGFVVMDRLGRFTGRHVAFALGLAWAWVAWLVRPRRERGPNPWKAVTTFGVVLAYACGLAYTENRRADLAKLVRLAEPFALARGTIPYGVYQGLHAFPDIVSGRLGSAEVRLQEALDAMQNDRRTPVADEERAFAEAGLRGLRAIVDANQCNPRVYDDLEAIDALGFRYYRLVVQSTRAVIHRFRGEEAKARAIEKDMELALLQLGTWSLDVQLLFHAQQAYALCRDLSGLKRTAVQLERLVAQGFRVEARLAIGRAEYCRERGEVGQALAILERTLAGLEPDDHGVRQWCLSSLAETALAGGAAEDCLRYAEQAMSEGRDPIIGLVMPRLRSTRSAALAKAMLGRTAEALALLAPAIEEAEAIDNPPLAGALHEAAARVARAAGDVEAYEGHAAEMTRWFRSTENPALIAFGEHLITQSASSVPPPLIVESLVPTSSVSQ